VSAKICCRGQSSAVAGAFLGNKFKLTYALDARNLCAYSMRKGCDMSTVTKKSTNLSLPEDVLLSARALNLNLSRELEMHLRKVIRDKQSEQWRLENREAIAETNRETEREGLWSDGLRLFLNEAL
jgi:antitoxin CcdA